MAARQLVTIIVLNWNGRDDTLACIESLEQLSYPHRRIVMVDNGSLDGSIEAVKAAHPQVHVIATGRNLGFAEGNNIGIRHALSEGADCVLILNNDTIVAPDLIEGFFQAFDEYPDAGIIGPKIYYYGEPDRLWYAGGRWSEDGQCFEQEGQGQIDRGQYDRSGPTGFVVGCAMFIPRTVLERVGMLDSRYFLNYEEIDWGTRAQAAGYSLIYAPTARVWHKVSASFGGDDSPLKCYYTFRNRLLWAKQHLSLKRRLRVQCRVAGIVLQRFLGPVFRFGQLRRGPRAYVWSVRSTFVDPVNRAIWMGVRDYVAGRFGPHPDDVASLHMRWKASRG